MFRPFLYYEPLSKPLVGNSRFSSEILIGQGITDASPKRDNSELSCLLNTSPNTQGMVSHRHKTCLSCRRFTSLVLKSKAKVLIAMVLRSHYSHFLLFSESPTSSAIPTGVDSYSLLYFAAFQLRGSAFLNSRLLEFDEERRYVITAQ